VQGLRGGDVALGGCRAWGRGCALGGCRA
jgi:hypothetical protein